MPASIDPKSQPLELQLSTVLFFVPGRMFESSDETRMNGMPTFTRETRYHDHHTVVDIRRRSLSRTLMKKSNSLQ